MPQTSHMDYMCLPGGDLTTFAFILIMPSCTASKTLCPIALMGNKLFM